MDDNKRENLHRLLEDALDQCIIKRIHQELGKAPTSEELCRIKQENRAVINVFFNNVYDAVDIEMDRLKDKIGELSDQLSYLQEVTMAQRQMLNDNLDYLKPLD